jgi:hypothetical protein
MRTLDLDSTMADRTTAAASMMVVEASTTEAAAGMMGVADSDS